MKNSRHRPGETGQKSQKLRTSDSLSSPCNTLKPWQDLRKTVRNHVDLRRCGLIALGVALGHGGAGNRLAPSIRLLGQYYGPGALLDILCQNSHSPLSSEDREIVEFAQRVAADLTGTGLADIQALAIAPDYAHDIVAAVAQEIAGAGINGRR